MNNKFVKTKAFTALLVCGTAVTLSGCAGVDDIVNDAFVEAAQDVASEGSASAGKALQDVKDTAADTVTVGGPATATVDGKTVALNDALVSCNTADNRVMIGIVAQDGGSIVPGGIGAVINGTSVESVGVATADLSSNVAYNSAVGIGHAQVEISGKTYRIFGEGATAGIDTGDPLRALNSLVVPFELTVTCP